MKLVMRDVDTSQSLSDPFQGPTTDPAPLDSGSRLPLLLTILFLSGRTGMHLGKEIKKIVNPDLQAIGLIRSSGDNYSETSDLRS